MNFEVMRVQNDLLGRLDDLGKNGNSPLIIKSPFKFKVIEGNIIIDWL